MSSGNMLRTRRRDNNVKPNRRLDRKSSRGMIFENEELRLKTININAEVERGQSDIKKLKRENDQLKREIWYLRDEYEKLDKLLRMKQLQCVSSSSTSCTSDSDSCSSCTEETEGLETFQNIANVQKTVTDGNFYKDFDHLSVVPEENSAENSSSNRGSLCNEQWDTDVIQPDQSYPFYENLPNKKEQDSNVYDQHILPNQHYEETSNNQFLGLEQPHLYGKNEQDDRLHLKLCMGQNIKNSLQSGAFKTNGTDECQGKFGIQPDIRYYENLSFLDNENNANTLPILQKCGTDLIAKTDNKDFSSIKSQSSFSNGGNLEELLNDIETISQDILKISNVQKTPNENYQNVENSDLPVLQNHTNIQVENDRKYSTETQESPYRSQLNVIVMPTPMPIIGVEKYKNLQRSCESIQSQSIEDLSASKTNLKILEETLPFVPVPPICPGSSVTSKDRSLNFGSASTQCKPKRPDTPPKFNSLKGNLGQITPVLESNLGHNMNSAEIKSQLDISNSPFYFGNYENKAFTFENMQEDLNSINICPNLSEQTTPQTFNKTENDENSKIPNAEKIEKGDTTEDTTKVPKLSIRRKVSIHFKGKKDKKKSASANYPTDSKPQSAESKKSSFFNIKFQTEVDNGKKTNTKSEPKTTNLDPKTPTSVDSKSSIGDNKNSTCESKSSNSDQKNSSGEQKSSTPTGETKQGEQKQRKSSSASPDRGKHKHGKGDTKKCHKKHRKGDKLKHRKGSLTTDRILRERSFSVCTDRSNILDHKLGLGYGLGFCDDSDNRSSDSSCSSNITKSRKISVISNIPSSGKIPWCACWGNGCL